MMKWLWAAIRWGVFIALSMWIAAAASAEGLTRYYRQLAYNHVSPHVPLRGVHEIDASTAASAVHYVFRYDAAGRLVEIVNNNPEEWKTHPLTSLGVARMAIAYTGQVETRTFFNREGKAVNGIRGAAREVFENNPDGSHRSLQFQDGNGQAVESDWHIARYDWEKHGDLVVERRYNLKGLLVPISPYFKFGVSGIKYAQNGFTAAHYNLDEKTLAITNNALGIASYNDRYDDQGNHLEFSYHDQEGRLTKSPWGYAIGRKYYDERGNVIRMETVELDGRISSAEVLTYDAAGRITSRTKEKI